MTIQINKDISLSVHETYQAQLKDLLSGELNRFDEHITRLELHLSDENGNKESENDKRCLLEVRLKGRQPMPYQMLQILMNHIVMEQLIS